MRTFYATEIEINGIPFVVDYEIEFHRVSGRFDPLEYEIDRVNVFSVDGRRKIYPKFAEVLETLAPEPEILEHLYLEDEECFL